MFSLKMFIVLALALFGSASAVDSTGSCPDNVTVQPNFDVARYLGVWYEYEKYPTVYEPNGKCNTANYTLQADGNVGVYNTLIDISTGELSGINGYAYVESNGKLKVVFPVTSTVNTTSNYWVLGTDYTSYSVVYSCNSVTATSISTTAWVLTRDRIPSPATIATAENILVQNCVSLTPLVKTVQTGCDAAGC